MSLFSREPWPSPTHVGLLRRGEGGEGHWLTLPFTVGLLVLHSGDYFLFETDSEEDEESAVEDPKPPKQSAFQVRRGRFPPTRPWGAQVLLAGWDGFIGIVLQYKVQKLPNSFVAGLSAAG